MIKWLKITLFTLFLLFSFNSIGQDIWLNNWTPSDNSVSAYGKGRFFYRISRTVDRVEPYNQFIFKVHFISDSYYEGYIYDLNNNNIIESNEPVYRASTKVDNIELYVDNKPCVNILTKTNSFWILFKGDYNAGVGDVCIMFYTPNPNAKMWLKWSQPKVY